MREGRARDKGAVFQGAAWLPLLCSILLVAGLTAAFPPARTAIAQEAREAEAPNVEYSIRRLDVQPLENVIRRRDFRQGIEVQSDGSELVQLAPTERTALASSMESRLRELGAAPNEAQIVAFDHGLLESGPRAQTVFVPVAVALQPLQYDPSTRMATGRIMVYFVQQGPGGIQQARPLPREVSLRLTGASSTDPETLNFAVSNEPQYADVRFRRPPSNRTVRIVSPVMAGFNEPLEFSEEPFLLINAGDPAVEGLGLESTYVTVQLLGVENPAGRTVSVVADGGVLSSNEVTLNSQGFASVNLTSDFLGTARVTVRSPEAEASSIAIGMTAPWRTLAAMAFGILVGWSIRLFIHRKDPEKKALSLFLGSLLGGFIGYVFYTAGINLFGTIAVNAVGALAVFVLATLGAWLGIEALSAFLRKLKGA